MYKPCVMSCKPRSLLSI